MQELSIQETSVSYINIKTMKFIYLSVFFVSGLLFTGKAQQESQFINVANNPFIVNPAAGGFTDVIQLEVTARTQWMGYNGGPQTLMLVASSQIKLKKSEEKLLTEFKPDGKPFFKSPEISTGKVKHVLGGKAINDVIGVFAKTSLHANYSIHLPFSKNMNFGAGLGLGWSNFRINQSRVELYQEDDMAYAQFLGNTVGQNYIDANAGLVFYGKHFVAGFSTSQLLRNKAKFDNVATESNLNRHYFLTAKYTIEFTETFAIEPMIVGKFAENSPSSFDFGARVIHDQKAWAGLYYRTSNAIAFQLGANIIKNFYLSYGFEFATGIIKTSGNSSHEIQLGFYLGKKKSDEKAVKEIEKEEKPK